MKLAFIGGWGHHYLRGLLVSGQSPVDIEAAVCGDGHDADAAKRWAAAHGVSRWFDDPAQMLEVFKPDGVSVGAVYGYNGDWICEALLRDVPTVSDKPIAATWKQFERICEIVAGGRKILLTEFDFRSRREFRAAHDAIAEGLIGDVILATAQKSYRFGSRPAWYANRESYPGTLLWIASHGIDAIHWVTGRRASRVVGHQGNISRPAYGPMEDHLAVLMELDNGGTGVVHADLLRPAAAASHGDDRLRVAGSRGVVEVRDDQCRLITQDQGEIDITDRAVVRPIHLELLAALQGEKNPWYSTAASLEMAEVLLHARDATDGGRWVELGVGSR